MGLRSTTICLSDYLVLPQYCTNLASGNPVAYARQYNATELATVDPLKDLTIDMTNFYDGDYVFQKNLYSLMVGRIGFFGL